MEQSGYGYVMKSTMLRDDLGAIAKCKVTIADTTRSTAAVTAAGVRLEALLSRAFPITPEETAAMKQAVADADAAYHTAMRVRSDYDTAHQAARQKLQAMRDDVFGSTPGSRDLLHTNLVLHNRLREVEEEAK